MSEIASISLVRMNNGAHFLFMSNVSSRAAADEKVSAKAASQVAALKAALEKEDECLKLSQKSLYTDEISAADIKRDELYSGYKSAVRAFLKHPVADMAKAAKVLNQHLKDYAIDPKMQLDTETGLLVNLIADLEGKYKAEVELLALTSFVTHLKAANEQLRTLTGSRTDERTGKIAGALSAARKASNVAYRKLVTMVNALATVEGSADYSAFIDYMNTEIAHYKREVLGDAAATTTTTTTRTDDAPVMEEEGDEDDVPEAL